MTRQLSSSSTRESAVSSRESDSNHSHLATTEASAIQGIFRAGLADAEIVRVAQAITAQAALVDRATAIAEAAVPRGR